MPLSDVAVRTAKPRAAAYKMADEKALFLLVTPAGARYWRFKYRHGGKEKSLALGVYPETSLASARKERDAARVLLKSGVDPSRHRKVVRMTARTNQETTFGVIADEFVARKIKEGKSAKTVAKAQWLLTDIACPLMGKRPIAEISPAEILAVLRPVEASGRLETAKRLRAIIGAVFRYAVQTARATQDPTQTLKGALLAPKVTGRAAILEPAKFGALLRSIDGYHSTVVRSALLLSALLFQRPGELRQAEWCEFDLDAAIWTIPESRMKMRRPHRVPLSKQAVQVLNDLHAATGAGRLCFPGSRSAHRPISDMTMNAALRAMGFAGEQMSAHAFRSSASTLLNDSGKFSPDVIEAALAHAGANKIRSIYNRGDYFADRVTMATWWADHCDQLRVAA
jgi:integrase